MTAAIIAGLRAWTRGHDPHVRAAVELLIEHDVWLRRADFTRACVRSCNGQAWIDWQAARVFADAGAVASTSEMAILDLAVALGENRTGCRSWAPRTPGRSPPRWPARPE